MAQISVVNVITYYIISNTAYLLFITLKRRNFVLKDAHITPYVNKPKWIKVQHKYNYDTYTCILIHKVIQGNYLNWQLPIQTTSNLTSVHIRQNNSIYIKRSNLETGARNLQLRGLVIWNQFPENIKNISHQKTRKTKMKTHYWNINDTWRLNIKLSTIFQSFMIMFCQSWFRKHCIISMFTKYYMV